MCFFRPISSRVPIAVAVVLGMAACKDEERTSPLKKPTDTKPIVSSPARPQLAPTSAPSPSSEPTPDPAELRRQFEAVKKEALAQLQPLIRRFDRKKFAYEVSETQYLEKLYLWTLTFSMLEARSNPGTFAGDLPEHESFPFSEFTESAENLLADLNVYLDRYAEKDDPELDLLTSKRQEANNAVIVQFPGTGSRLQDAIAAMRSARFKAVVDASNPKVAELAAVGGIHVVNSVGEGVGKAVKFLDALFNTTRKP